MEWLSCVQECYREDICFSYNFFAAEKICELNNYGLKYPCNADNILIRTSGWIYHEIVTSQDLMPSKGSREKPTESIKATFTCDNEMEMFADGLSLGKDGYWPKATDYVIPGNTRVISVAGKDTGSQFGILGSFSNGLVTDASWKCINVFYSGWNFPDFNDSKWPAAVEVAQHGDRPWGNIAGIATTAKWIWTAGYNDDNVYCRLHLR
ncbi:uncharacterized protein LOC144638494 [Oculina patagonica]